MKALTFLAELALEATRAGALAVGAVAVSAAVGHLALVMAQTALLALPARVALALSVDVLPSLTTQHRAHT